MLWEVLLLSLGALLGLVAVAVTLLLWLAQLQGNSSRRRDRTRNTTPHPALHSPPTHLAPLDTQVPLASLTCVVSSYTYIYIYIYVCVCV